MIWFTPISQCKHEKIILKTQDPTRDVYYLECVNCMSSGIGTGKLKCSLCTIEFIIDKDIQKRMVRHEDFTHPASKTSRNVIPKYGKQVMWSKV
jgi:hypothetical protein